MDSTQTNSKLVYQYIWTETLFSVFEIAPTISNESWEKWAVLITTNTHIANELGASMYLLNGLAGDNYLGLHKIVGDDTYSVQVSIEGKQIKMVPYNSDGANVSFIRLV